MQEGLDDYAALVRGAAASGIPVVASINCVGNARWGEYARRVTDAGASALEINAGFLSAAPDADPRAVERRLLDLVAEAKASTSLPISVKLGQSWTSLAAVATSLSKAGASGLVFFNRFYSLDLDLATLKPTAGPLRSAGTEYHEALRWISLLSGRLPLQFSASSGIHDAQAALKLIAAGASTVQLCSTVYVHGYSVASSINAEMEASLGSLGYADLRQLRGAFAQWRSGDPDAYLRLQYVKALTGIA
jgi:dihydroorotate dehydrogenase (fumarate)